MSEYRIADVEPPEPTQGRWLERVELGRQGDGRPVYGATRRYELRWNLASWEDWAALVGFFRQIESTGTVSVRLPAWPAAGMTTATFWTYSGCVLGEPEVGPFFAETYPTDVVLVIGNIRTAGGA